MEKNKNVWLQKRLLGKMSQNYDNLSDFVKRSRVPLSMETIRKLLHDGEDVNALSIVLIAKYLGFPKKEIKEMLSRTIKGANSDDRDVRVAKDIVDLISDDMQEPMAPNEAAVIEFTRLMTAHNHKSYNLLVHIAELFADLTGVGVEEALKMRLPGDHRGGG